MHNAYLGYSFKTKGSNHTVFLIKRKRQFRGGDAASKCLILFVISMCFNNVLAHEMWLEPLNYEIAAGDKLLANEKVGQDFKGNNYAYLHSSYQRLNYTINGKTHLLSPRLGSLPAIQTNIQEEGLLILSAMTTRSKLTYKDRKIFEKFLNAEGLEWVFKAHKDRNLPESGFAEVYRRFPKSLVKVGNGLGQDKPLGMPLEWVALTNPYEIKGSIKLQLLSEGKPYAGIKVNVFNKFTKEPSSSEATFKETVNKTIKSKTTENKTKNDVVHTSYFTDEKGILNLPLKENSKYLINAVKMIEPDTETSHKYNAVWESLWASMTFQAIK
jgi:uncharacterized GH25 family protein